jgi:hypothetical protein
MHTTDCCGSQMATGISTPAKNQFDSAETSCGGPMCQCAPRPTTTDSGQTDTSGHIAVDCVNRICRTFVP